jgi:ABC-type branched-subunit amino acid transport system substrate-binding protein
MEVTFDLTKSISILTDIVFGGDVFLRQVNSVANETLAFINKLIASPDLDLNAIENLKGKWDDISKYKRFYLPGSRASRLKKDCLSVAIDIASIINKHENTNTKETLRDIQFLLIRIRNNSNLLLCGDSTRLLSPAIQKTKRYLRVFHSESRESVRMGQLRARASGGNLSAKIRHEFSGSSNNTNDPRDLWKQIRRNSRYSNPMIYRESDRVLRLLNRIISNKQKTTQEHITFKNGRCAIDNSHAINSIHIQTLEEELSYLSRYLWIARRNNIRVFLRLIGILFLFLFLGVFLSRIMKLSNALADPVKASEGEKIIAPINKKENDERMTDPGCYENHILKQQAVDSYPRNIAEAHRLMGKFVTLCPGDAEAQIYYNNYDVIIKHDNLNDSRHTIKLAVVVPLLRPNGIKDSFEILRGVSLAQFQANNQVHDQLNPKPFILIKIFNDGAKINNEREKGILAQRVAESIVSERITSNSRYPLIGVIGHFSSGSTEAASKVYHIRNIPVISPTSTNRREPLDSYRYRLDGSWLIHRIIDYAPFETIANVISSFFEEYLFFLDHIIFDNFSSLKPGHLDLDPNIYRMPPTDDKAQKRLLEYLEEYNRYNKNTVGQILVVSEEKNISRYSANFLQSLKEISGESQGYGYKILDVNCHFMPGSASIKNYRNCVTDALRNTTNTIALLIVPSSSNVNDALKNVKQIIEDTRGKKDLVVLGADSLMSAFSHSSDESTDPIYDGIVVSATTDNSESRLSINADDSKNIATVLTWRSHMAFDSVIFFQEISAEAIEHHEFPDLRKIRRYIIDNFTKPIQSNFSNGEKLVRFDPLTHDRQFDDDNKRMNILLCKTSSVQNRKLFKVVEFTSGNDICK